MISKDLLARLQCPDDRTSLGEAPPELIHRLNQAISAGQLKNRGGQLVERALDAGLLRCDGQMLYPVFGGIPNMLMDEAIPLNQMTGG